MQGFCSNSKLLILAMFSDLLAFFFTKKVIFMNLHYFFILNLRSFTLKQCAQVSTPLVKGSFTPSIELCSFLAPLPNFGGRSAFFSDFKIKSKYIV